MFRKPALCPPTSPSEPTADMPINAHGKTKYDILIGDQVANKKWIPGNCETLINWHDSALTGRIGCKKKEDMNESVTLCSW